MTKSRKPLVVIELERSLAEAQGRLLSLYKDIEDAGGLSGLGADKEAELYHLEREVSFLQERLKRFAEASSLADAEKGKVAHSQSVIGWLRFGDEFDSDLAKRALEMIEDRRKDNVLIWLLADNQALREENEKLKISPYCGVCGSCGEDGCCPAEKCCLYPEMKNETITELRAMCEDALNENARYREALKLLSREVESEWASDLIAETLAKKAND